MAKQLRSSSFQHHFGDAGLRSNAADALGGAKPTCAHPCPIIVLSKLVYTYGSRKKRISAKTKAYIRSIGMAPEGNGLETGKPTFATRSTHDAVYTAVLNATFQRSAVFSYSHRYELTC